MAYSINNFTIDASAFYDAKYVGDKQVLNMALNKYIKTIDYTSEDIITLTCEYGVDLYHITNSLSTKSGTMYVRLYEDRFNYETLVITGIMERFIPLALDKNNYSADRELELRLLYTDISHVIHPQSD